VEKIGLNLVMDLTIEDSVDEYVSHITMAEHAPRLVEVLGLKTLESQFIAFEAAAI